MARVGVAWCPAGGRPGTPPSASPGRRGVRRRRGRRRRPAGRPPTSAGHGHGVGVEVAAAARAEALEGVEVGPVVDQGELVHGRQAGSSGPGRRPRPTRRRPSHGVHAARVARGGPVTCRARRSGGRCRAAWPSAQSARRVPAVLVVPGLPAGPVCSRTGAVVTSTEHGGVPSRDQRRPVPPRSCPAVASMTATDTVTPVACGCGCGRGAGAATPPSSRPCPPAPSCRRTWCSRRSSGLVTAATTRSSRRRCPSGEWRPVRRRRVHGARGAAPAAPTTCSTCPTAGPRRPATSCGGSTGATASGAGHRPGRVRSLLAPRRGRPGGRRAGDAVDPLPHGSERGAATR